MAAAHGQAVVHCRHYWAVVPDGHVDCQNFAGAGVVAAAGADGPLPPCDGTASPLTSFWADNSFLRCVYTGRRLAIVHLDGPKPRFCVWVLVESRSLSLLTLASVPRLTI